MLRVPPGVQVSHTQDLTKSLLVTGFGYEHDECWATNIELFKHFTDVTQVVPAGTLRAGPGTSRQACALRRLGKALHAAEI